MDLLLININDLVHFFVFLYFETFFLMLKNIYLSWVHHLSLQRYPMKNRSSIIFFFSCHLKWWRHFAFRRLLFFFLSILMSSRKYPRYFYSNIEFPKIDIKKTKQHNCYIDGFFQFYCSILTNRSNNYLARLPAFNQCTEQNKWHAISLYFLFPFHLIYI